jgi:phosphatidylcholine synthase
MLPLRFSDIAAASVHLFTGLGAVCGLLAALAAFDGAWESMFAWLGLALIIDGIDGTFARMAHVEKRLPRFSGERLDLVVDYVTYVFVPALALLRAGYLTGTSGVIVAALILLSSLYHFSDLSSKGEDYSFVGFPAVWNIVAFYVFALTPPVWLTYAALLACVVLTFVPMHWVHPMRGVGDRRRRRRLAWFSPAVVDTGRPRHRGALCLGADARALAATALGRLAASRASSAGTHPTPAPRQSAPPGNR